MSEVAEVTKKRIAKGHKPDCQCGFCSGKGRGRKPKPTTQNVSFGTEKSTPPSISKDAPVPAVSVKDNLDVKLDHFQYTLDPEEAAVWEHDESLSPLYVSKAIRDKYPKFAWHWVSSTKLQTKGTGYNGWQLFRDNSHPEGIKRGNDLHLAAMPKEMAESYRRRVSERSTEAVKNIQERGIAKMEKALGELGDPNSGMLAPGEQVAGRSVSGTVEIGRRGRVGLGGNYQRGLSREEAHEQIAKHIEERRKNRVYSFQGQK